MVNDKQKNDSLHFHYITFDQIDNLESFHPLIYKSFPPDKFQFLVDCPDISDDFPCFFYLTDNDKIVSFSSTLPDTLSVDGKDYRWAWSGGLFTDPVHRGKGLATLLIKEMLKVLHQKNIARAAVFSADATVHIYRKIGVPIPGYYSRYLFLKTAYPFLEYHVRSKLVVWATDLLYRATIRLILPLLRRLAGPKTFDVVVDEIDVKSEAVLNIDFPKLCYTETYHFNDSLAKIAWKLKEAKHDTRLYVIKQEKTKEPLCYFVLRRKHVTKPLLDKYGNFTLMTLMDYGFFNNDVTVYKSLIQQVFTLFWKSEADVLEVISSSNILNSYVKRIGMIKVGKGVSFAFSVPQTWNFSPDSLDLNKWHLTHFCGDAFSFE